MPIDYLTKLSVEVKKAPYPAPSKEAIGLIDGVETEAVSMYFSDKIMIMLTQRGRLSQWMEVPMSAPSPAVDMALPNPSLLPLPHLTPRTLIGGGGEERETRGQLYAVQIASHIVRSNPEERRGLLVGMGLDKPQHDREAFFDMLELVQKVL